jgi:hypothetical protein
MREVSARRIASEKSRQSKRPSRHGRPAGTSSPERTVDDHGMPRLLRAVVEQASRAQTPGESLAVLLTLGGHVPEAVSRRALTDAERAALAARFERIGRNPGDQAVFVGALGLTPAGKVVIGVPRHGGDAESHPLDVAVRVEWTREDLEIFDELAAAEHRASQRDAAACREWLGMREPAELTAVLERLRHALLHTAPLLLYRDDRLYTNFREQNNLTGKSLVPDHPNCVLNGLEHIPVREWSDDQVTLVACMSLLSNSGGNHRIEECNGMQIDLRQVAHVFEQKARIYRDAGAAPAETVLRPDPSPAELEKFGAYLRAVRDDLRGEHLLYRRISGPILHKTELVMGPGTVSADRESAILAHLRETLPLRSCSWDDAMTELVERPGWLIAPHSDFGTGLEALIYRTVAVSVEQFSAHFGLSRGLRSIGTLVEQMRAEEWGSITSWELPEFFCCVVPAESALPLFGGSREALTDAAWAMSARMQYNSWHFLAGNLPKVPPVEARDYFTPPTMPDISDFSDQHHRGHVFNGVRFTIRSPQPVGISGRRFDGFVDLRLVRCDGDPFREQDLRDAHRVSRFLAVATECVAERVAGGERVELRAFDHVWHREWAERRLR